MLRRLAVFTAIPVPGLIFSFVNPTPGYLLTATTFALAGLHVVLAIVEERSVPRRIQCLNGRRGVVDDRTKGFPKPTMSLTGKGAERER